MASCVSMYAIILAFGPVAPLVGLMGTLCLICKTTVAQILLGRLLGHILHKEKNKEDSSHQPKSHPVGRRNSNGATQNPLQALRVNNLLDNDKKSNDDALATEGDDIPAKGNQGLNERQLRNDFVLKMGDECRILQKNTIWENRFTLMLTASTWYGCCLIDIYGLHGETFVQRIVPAIIIFTWPVIMEGTRYIVHTIMQQQERSNKNDKEEIKEIEGETGNTQKNAYRVARLSLEDGVDENRASLDTKKRNSTYHRTSMTRASGPIDMSVVHRDTIHEVYGYRPSANPMHSSMDEDSGL